MICLHTISPGHPYNQGGFPSRFSTLPNIYNKQDSSNAESHSQIMPYMPPGGGMQERTLHAEELEEKLRLLEMRLNVTEKSNRALLDELVRVEGELKLVSKKQDEGQREERTVHRMLEQSIRASGDVVDQLNGRLKNAEDRLQHERDQLSAVLTQAKNVQEHLLSAQNSQGAANRQENTQKVQALETQLDEVVRSRNQLERISYQLVEEVRALKQRLEGQIQEFSGTTQEIKLKTRRMEDQVLNNIDMLRRQFQNNEEVRASQEVDPHRTAHIDSRLTELRDLIAEMRSRQDKEESERRGTEHRLGVKITDLSRNVHEENVRRQETLRDLDTALKDYRRATDAEKIGIQQQISDAVEELTRKLMDKETRLKEEQHRKQTELEKMIQAEQETRLQHERELLREQEKRLEELRRQTEDESTDLKEKRNDDRHRYNDILKRIDEAVSLLEKQIQNGQNNFDRVLSAEIKTRKKKDRSNSERMSEVEAKISAATSTLQQAIGGVSKSVQMSEDTMREYLDMQLKDHRGEMHRYEADTDVRVASLKNRLASLDAQLDARVAALIRDVISNPEEKEMIEATAEITRKLREHVQSISAWQAGTNITVGELVEDRARLAAEVDAVGERHRLLKSDVDSQVKSEQTQRAHEIESLQREIANLKNNMPKDTGVTRDEFDSCQAGIRKLAESMQTVKTVLGIKIQSEQKLRMEEIKGIQDELVRLRAQVDPLLREYLKPRLFVKPKEKTSRFEAERDAENINKWSLYSAYRKPPGWVKWKDALRRYKEQAAAKKNAPVLTSTTTADDDDDDDEDDDEETETEPSPRVPTPPRKKPPKKKPPPPPTDSEDEESTPPPSRPALRALPEDDEEDSDDDESEDDPTPRKPFNKAASKGRR